jgi:hypothetical protein
METTTLFSSHGDVIIQTPNGNIVEHNVDSDSYINDVERFDIAEYYTSKLMLLHKMLNEFKHIK